MSFELSFHTAKRLGSASPVRSQVEDATIMKASVNLLNILKPVQSNHPVLSVEECSQYNSKVAPRTHLM